MADASRPTTSAGSTPPSKSQGKSEGARQRIITSCLTCRRRKVRCDHGHPICGACIRGNHTCVYAAEQSSGPPASSSASNRVTKPSLPGASRNGRNVDVQSRLDRLESLLERAVASQRPPNLQSPTEGHTPDPSALTPSSNSTSSHGAAGISTDGHDGTLLLENGQSKFVSSLHWSLLADEIQDIKALLGDRSEEEATERMRPYNPNCSMALLSFGSAPPGSSLSALLPKSQETCNMLLDIFFSHVDPMVRITHNPTLIRKFDGYVRDAHPIAFAVFFSAINALTPSAVEKQFHEKQDTLLERYQQGVEISLARENYLTSSSLEVLQGLLLWLTCVTKEDDMGKAWTLLGLVIRIALNQGLHRDPSLFPPGSIDAITVELRRRLWHQICHLEYRAAECKGQEPTVSDDDFTTMFPRNINDEDLVEGATPDNAPYNEDKFTDMAFQLVRFNGMRCLRRIIQSTYKLERRLIDSGLHGTSAPDPVIELQSIYTQIKVMVEQLREDDRTKYLKFANPEVPLQRLCLGLSTLMEWRAWVLFWLRMPRAYRDMVFSADIRKMIFEKSVNLIDTINGATVDVDAARFQWHIGGHAAFQAIMHVLSELRNPDFDTPDRLRALQALQTAKTIKQNVNSKAWVVVKGMIDKVITEHVNSRSLQSQVRPQSSTTESPQLPQKFGQMEYKATYPPSVFANQIPGYAIPEPMAYQAQPPTATNSMDFGDMNFNSLVGMDMNSNTGTMDFDWGFWGDPVTLGPMDFPPTF